MSGFLQASYSSGEGDFLHKAAHKEPELPCICNTGMPLRGAGEGGSAAALESHWRGTRRKESLLSPRSTQPESEGRQAGRALRRCQPKPWQPAVLPAPLPCRRGGRCEQHVLGEGTSCWQLQK